MRKVSFRVRNFDKEQFLTFNIDNEAELDETVLDFLEEEEPKGIVPIIFDDEEEDYDTFSYDITDKIRLTELSNQEIGVEMVLMVMHGIVTSLINMAEYRVPLSYLVMNRNYIYIDSDYKVEFICIPLEDMDEKIDVNGFLRGFISSLRFEPSENGDYVAKLLTYVNNTAIFNMHNLLTLVEELMDEYGIDIPVDEENEIYADYQEVEEVSATEIVDELDDESEEEETGRTSILTEDMKDEYFPEEENSEEEELSQVDQAEEPVEDASSSEELVNDGASESAIDEAKELIDKIKQQVLQEKNSEVTSESESADEEDEQESKEVTGTVVHDDLEDFLAEKEKEEKLGFRGDSGIKMKKNIKVSRASIVKQEEERAAEEAAELEEERLAAEEAQRLALEEEEAAKNPGATGLLKGASVPKANPYLVRVNTNERIMITKQTFKIGKASMGVDYTVKGNGAVSRIHAVITCRGDEYFIKDNKSTNHTYVNGKIVEEGDDKMLSNGSKIMLGDEEFIFKFQ